MIENFGLKFWDVWVHTDILCFDLESDLLTLTVTLNDLSRSQSHMAKLQPQQPTYKVCAASERLPGPYTFIYRVAVEKKRGKTRHKNSLMLFSKKHHNNTHIIATIVDKMSELIPMVEVFMR